MNYPGTEQYELIPVFSNQGGRGQIIDDEVMAEQEAIKEAIKNGFAMLAECFVRKDDPTVLTILLDSSHPNRVRQKAAEMMGDIGEWEPLNRCAMPNSAINWFKKKSTRPLPKYTKEISPASARFVPRSLKSGPRFASIAKRMWLENKFASAKLIEDPVTFYGEERPIGP